MDGAKHGRGCTCRCPFHTAMPLRISLCIAPLYLPVCLSVSLVCLPFCVKKRRPLRSPKQTSNDAPPPSSPSSSLRFSLLPFWSEGARCPAAPLRQRTPNGCEYSDSPLTLYYVSFLINAIHPFGASRVCAKKRAYDPRRSPRRGCWEATPKFNASLKKTQGGGRQKGSKLSIVCGGGLAHGAHTLRCSRAHLQQDCCARVAEGTTEDKRQAENINSKIL